VSGLLDLRLLGFVENLQKLLSGGLSVCRRLYLELVVPLPLFWVWLVSRTLVLVFSLVPFVISIMLYSTLNNIPRKLYALTSIN